MAQPADRGASLNGVVGFSVNVASQTPVTFQWKFNDHDIPGATADSLLIARVTAESVGAYTVVVTNASGSVTSNPAKLYIDANGNGIPDSWELQYFGTLSHAAEEDFDGDGFTNLEEFQNGTDPLTRATVQWIAASGDFNNPNNWNPARVPGKFDSAVIDSGTFTLPVAGTFTASRVTINVPYTVPADVEQSLTVTGNWTFNAAVTLAAGEFFYVAGTGRVEFAGPVNLNGSKPFVYGGGHLTISGLTEFTLPGNLNTAWTAQGDGSVLSLPNLRMISGGSTSGAFLTLRAYYGSKLELPLLETVTKADDGDPYGYSGIAFDAYDRAVISAPALATFTDEDDQPTSSLTAFGTGIISAPLLKAPRGLQINLNALSHPEQFVSLVNTHSFQITSGNVVMANLDTITGLRSVNVLGGATVSFPNVIDFVLPAGVNALWIAQNDGSTLLFPNLRTIEGNTTAGTYLTLRSYYGATLSLPKLTSISKPNDADAYPNSGVALETYDRAVISAPLLAAFNDQDAHPNSWLTASVNGVVAAPLLKAPQGVQINLNAASHPERFTSLLNTTSFQINAGIVSMESLNTIAGLTSINVSGGATLSFPKIAAYALPPGMTATWTAQGDGTTLSFPNLKTMAGSTSPSGYLNLHSYYGAKLTLPLLTSITKGDDADPYANSGVTWDAYDRAQILAPRLSVFNDNDRNPGSSLSASGNGIISAPLLTAPRGVQMNLNALSHPERFTSLVNTRSFQINAGVVAMSNLTQVEGMTSIIVTGGATLSFPKVAAFKLPAGGSVTWTAQGAGSTLVFPMLGKIEGSTTAGAYLFLHSYYGAELSLPALTTILKPDDADPYANSGIALEVYSQGRISAPMLASFSDNDVHPNSSLSASANGTFLLTSLGLSGTTGVALSGVTLPPMPYSLITSPASASIVAGEDFTYQITATNSPTGFGATGLPAGLTFDAATASITGSSTVTGVFNIALSATNSQGTSSGVLKLTINPQPPEPAGGLVYSGLINSGASTAISAGFVQFTFTSSGKYTGKLTMGGAAFSFNTKLDASGNFPALRFGSGAAAWILEPAWSSGDEIVGTVRQEFTAYSFQALRSPYSASRPVPAAMAGKFTAELPLQGSLPSGLRGKGYLSVVVASTGGVTYIGKLPDGAVVSGGSSLSIDSDIVLYAPLYNAGGAVFGAFDLAAVAGSDFTGTARWFRPATAGTALFSAGWPAGVTVNIAGSHYSPPAKASVSTSEILPLPGQPPTDNDGNVSLTLGLSGGSVTRKMNLSPAGVFTAIAPLAAGEALTLKLTLGTGVMTGSYRRSASAGAFALEGVLYQKTNKASGYALDSAQSAPITLQLAP